LLVRVYVNVAVPAAIAVINPALVIVATAVLLLVHVPSVDGVMLAVAPTHKVNGDGDPIVGFAIVVIVILLLSVGHPVLFGVV
jgi:hypothetical protein